MNKNEIIIFETDEKTIRKHINNVFAEGELVALTIMIAESNPEEKELMISVIMNCII